MLLFLHHYKISVSHFSTYNFTFSVITSYLHLGFSTLSVKYKRNKKCLIQMAESE